MWVLADARSPFAGSWRGHSGCLWVGEGASLPTVALFVQWKWPRGLGRTLGGARADGLGGQWVASVGVAVEEWGSSGRDGTWST